MNELIRPFITIPGNSRTPKRIEAEGHYYEIFIDGGSPITPTKQTLVWSKETTKLTLVLRL